MVAGVMTIRGAALGLLCMLPVAAWAQVLPDPTRPPLEIGDGSTSAQPVAPAVAKGLLSVLISPGRCAAIIDGKTIRLGEKYGDATLVEINAHGVVLQGIHARRSMELFPDVGVKVTAPQPPLPPAVTCTLENQKPANQKLGNQKKVIKKPSGKAGLEEKK